MTEKEEAIEVKEEAAEEEEVKEEVTEIEQRERRGKRAWIPKTKLGHKVLKGEYATIDDVLRSGELILEGGIVDYLIPELKEEIIYIGGSPGKFG